MGAFICQISEKDWRVSRKIGVYGNREGSERNGKVVYFAKSEKGDQIIQSIIEDLIGMRKGDIVFFHVIETTEGESSIHGVFNVREEPFFNDKVKLWKSSPHFVYPYRFCFEPHPEHAELCKYDASILVSEFYRSIENRNIRSLTTLEREVRGAAHAVKKITREDADEIVKLLYRDFHHRRLQDPVDFKPAQMQMLILRNYIRRIGEIEFAIKALVSYELGQRHLNLIQYIPACRNTDYDFLIETFIGQTMRRPLDILCIGSRDSEKLVTMIEAKTHRAYMNDLIQALKYNEMFKLRNIDRGSLTYKMSTCLLAQRFDPELTNYVSVRNVVLPHEEMILLKYTPIKNGRGATFLTEGPSEPSFISSRTYHKIDSRELLSKISVDPNDFYAAFSDKKIAPKTTIKFKSSEKDTIVLQKYYQQDEQRIPLGHVLIYEFNGACTLKDLAEFMNRVREEAEKFQGDFMAVEPIIIASDYNKLVKFFIEKYNKYETRVRRKAISAYLFPS